MITPSVTPEMVEEFKKIYKEEHGKDLSDQEAWDSAHSLIQLGALFLEHAEIEHRRQQRLKKEPEGFHLEEESSYNCCICWDQISGQQTWYDRYGIKCLLCQRALKKGIIPKRACRDRDSWLAAWKISHLCGIHPNSIKKLVRSGKLKARTILNDKGGIHYQIFLVKENIDFLKKHAKPTPKPVITVSGFGSEDSAKKSEQIPPTTLG